MIFGAGPLGLAVMRELRRQGKRVRLISRSGRVGLAKDTQTDGGGAHATG